MTIEINDSYIQWLRAVVFDSDEVSTEQVTEYVNDVLKLHRESWEDWEEPVPRRAQ